MLTNRLANAWLLQEDTGMFEGYYHGALFDHDTYARIWSRIPDSMSDAMISSHTQTIPYAEEKEVEFLVGTVALLVAKILRERFAIGEVVYRSQDRSPLQFETALWDVPSDETTSEDPPDLVEALLDLHDCQRVAVEAARVLPESATVKTAERILRVLYGIAPRPYAVYPMPEGDIAIDAQSPLGTKVVVICGPSGSARCLVYINGEFERREYEDISGLPDAFIKESLGKTEMPSAP